MSVRPMKWHIYNEEGYALCWDNMAIDFETEVEAKTFAKANVKDVGLYEIKKDILYNDGGYISCQKVIQLMEDESEYEVTV